MGRFVDTIEGHYITAEDVGTAVEDMVLVRAETKYVTGLPLEMGSSGDPSPWTALGCFVGIRPASKRCSDPATSAGRTVAIQGCGHVGRSSRATCTRPARSSCSPTSPERAKTLADETGATIVDPADILSVECDVFAPCALGAVVNDETLDKLHCKIIAGAANNVLLREEHGQRLKEAGILYAPDYVINAGGIINVSIEVEGAYDEERSRKKVENIYHALKRVFEIAKEQNISTNEASNHVAEERLAQGRGTRARPPDPPPPAPGPPRAARGARSWTVRSPRRGESASTGGSARGASARGSRSTGQVGRLASRKRPYWRVTIRGSRIVTAPSSLRRRIRRPKPCFSRSAATGSESERKGSRPSALSRSWRATWRGWVGTSKGRRAMITCRKASPGTSTPCQNEATPKSTASPSRKRAINAGRSRPWPWTSTSRPSASSSARDRLGHAAHRPVAREQHEGASLRSAYGFEDGRRQGPLECLRVAHRIRQVRRDTDLDLARVVEGAADADLRRLLDPEAIAQEREGGRASRRQGGGGQDHGVVLLPEDLGKERAHIDRRARHGDAVPSGLLDPTHLAVPGTHEILEDLGHAVELPGAGGELHRGVEVLGVACEAAHAFGEIAQARREHVVEGEAVLDRCQSARRRVGLGPRAEQAEERARHLVGVLDLPLQVLRARGREQTASPSAVPEAPEDGRRPEAGEAQPEMLGRRVLEIVRLVDDDGVDLRQEGGTRAAERQVGHQDVVVQDEAARLVRAATGTLVEAAGVVVAGASLAVPLLRAGEIPDTGRRTKRQVLATPLARRVRPRTDLLQLGAGAVVVEQGGGVLDRHAEPAETEVVRPALDQREAHVKRQGRCEQRQVLADELLLQCDRAGGDRNGPSGVGGPGEEGHEVRERLADARARLDDEVTPAMTRHRPPPGPWSSCSGRSRIRPQAR